MESYTRKQIKLQPSILDEANELAVTNFQLPSGAGNFNALVRYLIHTAYLDPARFGLAAPGQSVADLPTIEAEVVAQSAGQPPLDVSTLQENQPDWQSEPSDAGLPETVKALTRD